MFRFRLQQSHELRALVGGQRRHGALGRVRTHAQPFLRRIVPGQVVGDRADERPRLIGIGIEVVQNGQMRRPRSMRQTSSPPPRGRDQNCRVLRQSSTQTPDTSRSVSSAPAIAHLTVGPCGPAEPRRCRARWPLRSRTSSCTRAEKCSQKSGEGSGIAARRRSARASRSASDRSPGTRRRRRGAPRATARACRRRGPRIRLRSGVSSQQLLQDSPARGRDSPSPPRPSCRGCRQSPRAAAHDISAGSASRAASAATAGWPRVLRRRARRAGARHPGARRGRRRSSAGSSGSLLRRLEREPIEADVDRDAVEPGREARLPFEPLEALEGANECVLREVGGVLVVADVAIAQLIHLAAVTLDDDIECLAASGKARRRRASGRRLRPTRSRRPQFPRRRRRVWSSQATRAPSTRGSARVTRMVGRSARDELGHLLGLDRCGEPAG